MPHFQLIIRCLLTLCFIVIPLDSINEWFYDLFFQIRGKTKTKNSIVLIKINETRLLETLLENSKRIVQKEDPFLRGRPLAIWSSDLHSLLVKKIHAGNPKLVAFTNYYEKLDLRRGLNLETEQVPYVFSSIIDEDNRIVPPSPLLTTGENYGFANLFIDRDNIVRKTKLVYSFGVSLPLKIYTSLFHEPIQRNLIEPLWIDFQGPRGTYNSIDAHDLLSGEISPSILTNKIILIGREEAYPTFLQTPFGKTSRLEIMANTIDTLVNKKEIRLLPNWVSQLFGAIAIVSSIFMILFFPLTISWFLHLLFACLLIFISLFFFAQFKIWIGIATPLLCIFGTHLLLLGYKLRLQEQVQWKFKQETETLKEMDKFKNNFISLFSHDLKTPIAKIRAITERLIAENSDFSLEVVQSLKKIDKTNSELARLISDILKVTKMESMFIEPSREVVDLNRLVESVIHRLKFSAEEKKIHLIEDLEPLFSMEGDPKLIEEIITNLVENAIKYSQPNHSVIIRTREKGEGVEITVMDEGVGIPQDEIAKVTSKFYRGREVCNTTKGSGLGLYLSKYFIELHHGKMAIQSEFGKGTQVSFWLPIEIPA